jgi:hypothetical protein
LRDLTVVSTRLHILLRCGASECRPEHRDING